ncbi:MAG: sugar phosphate isomerase/epimerase [Spirochaetales bacterium]|nr:MAG: sugar phosphate isomerase/epimerase [Spirochaetales bacterium]
MKLGFVSAVFGDQSFEEVVDFASEAGFACVEMMCWPKGKAERRYAGVTHVDVTDLDGGKAGAVTAYCAERKVSISGLGYYPNPLTDDREQSAVFVDHIKKVIDASALLGIGVMNTFIGREHTKSVDYNFDRFREVWPSIVKHAEQKSVKIGIENCPMFFSKDEWPGGKNLASNPAMWRRMFEAVPSASFGLNYDPSHLVWQHMDYIAPIYEFRDRIFHVHLKDAKVIKDKLDQVGIMALPHEYHTPKLPGLGDGNWGRFFSALSDTGYKGAAVVELEDRAYEGTLASRKNGLLQSRNFLAQFIVSL